MEMIKEFINVYFTWQNLLFILLLGGALYGLVKAGWVKKETIWKEIEKTIIIIEGKLYSQTGQEKLKAVVEDIYNWLPPISKLLFTKDVLEKMVEEAFDWLKEQIVDDDNITHSTPVITQSKYI